LKGGHEVVGIVRTGSRLAPIWPVRRELRRELCRPLKRRCPRHSRQMLNRPPATLRPCPMAHGRLLRRRRKLHQRPCRTVQYRKVRRSRKSCPVPMLRLAQNARRRFVDLASRIRLWAPIFLRCRCDLIRIEVRSGRALGNPKPLLDRPIGAQRLLDPADAELRVLLRQGLTVLRRDGEVSVRRTTVATLITGPRSRGSRAAWGMSRC
jgi:hypothetical protein